MLCTAVHTILHTYIHTFTTYILVRTYVCISPCTTGSISRDLILGLVLGASENSCYHGCVLISTSLGGALGYLLKWPSASSIANLLKRISVSFMDAPSLAFRARSSATCLSNVLAHSFLRLQTQTQTQTQSKKQTTSANHRTHSSRHSSQQQQNVRFSSIVRMVQFVQFNVVQSFQFSGKFSVFNGTLLPHFFFQ